MNLFRSFRLVQLQIIGILFSVSTFSVFGWAESSWIFFQNHLHSHNDHTFSRFPESTDLEDSYSSEGIQALIDQAKEEGIDALAITDHNTISQWFDPVFQEEKEVLLLPAMEWTNMFGGHASLLGFHADHEGKAIVPRHPRTTLEASDYIDMMDETHTRGGLVIINHPKSLYVPHRWPANLYDADGIELNFSSFMQPGATLEWWEGQLKMGKKLFLLGGSDYHAGNFYGAPFESTNLILVEERSLNVLFESLKAGKIQVLRSPASPRVDIHAIRIDGQAFGIGEEVLLLPLQSLFLKIKVTGGNGGELEIYSHQGLVETVKITEDVFEYSDAYLPKYRNDYLWFKVKMDSELETVVNPLYLTQRF